MPRTLIITHSLPLARRLTEILTNAGREVLLARDQADAQMHFRRMKPEVAVIDACMPDSSGLEIAQGFVFENSETRLILMSSIDTHDIRGLALRCGARDMLIKPFSDEEFLFTINKYLEDFDAESA